MLPITRSTRGGSREASAGRAEKHDKNATNPQQTATKAEAGAAAAAAFPAVGRPFAPPLRARFHASYPRPAEAPTATPPRHTKGQNIAADA